MRIKFIYPQMIVLFVMVLGCSPQKPEPSVDALIKSGCLIDNRKYCGWLVFIREDKYCLIGADSITGFIKKDCDDTLELGLWPRGHYDSSYHVVYSLYKELTAMADVLNAKIDFYYNNVNFYNDSCEPLLFARMDFYNEDYDTNITLFQIDSALVDYRVLANRHKLKSIAKDWYTYNK